MTLKIGEIGSMHTFDGFGKLFLKRNKSFSILY